MAANEPSEASSGFLLEHVEATRRYFLQMGIAGAALVATVRAQETAPAKPKGKPDRAGARPDPYFTAANEFRDVSRGNPVPHSLKDAALSEARLTRESWRLEVVGDPEHRPKLGKEFQLADDTAIDFARLMQLAEKHAVRFAKVMTCLNLGCPLGMGLWEGVPLRELVWLTQPRENLRRVFYHGFHNNDPKQIFRSSLPVGRVLEDPSGLPPVIVCYKLNGEWLDLERGGPVRMLVPEAYGFKSVKWLHRITLTNLFYANDTYGEQNNDIESPLKTFAASLVVPREIGSEEKIPVSGYAQVGVAGLSKVQVSLEPKGEPAADDPYFTRLNWSDAEILPPPKSWTSLPAAVIPENTFGFDREGGPKSWPLKLANAHWAAVLPAVPPGDYVFRSRTIDENGYAQPLPRPFRKSGHCAIEAVDVRVVKR